MALTLRTSAGFSTAEIDLGITVLETALDRNAVGPDQLHAAIAACHATAPTWAATDWPSIAGVYGLLLEMLPSPIVELNRAAAIARADGPAAGLALVERLRAAGQLSRRLTDLWAGNNDAE